MNKYQANILNLKFVLVDLRVFSLKNPNNFLIIFYFINKCVYINQFISNYSLVKKNYNKRSNNINKLKNIIK